MQIGVLDVSVCSPCIRISTAKPFLCHYKRAFLKRSGLVCQPLAFSLPDTAVCCSLWLLLLIVACTYMHRKWKLAFRHSAHGSTECMSERVLLTNISNSFIPFSLFYGESFVLINDISSHKVKLLVARVNCSDTTMHEMKPKEYPKFLFAYKEQKHYLSRLLRKSCQFPLIR